MQETTTTNAEVSIERDIKNELNEKEEVNCSEIKLDLSENLHLNLKECGE